MPKNKQSKKNQNNNKQNNSQRKRKPKPARSSTPAGVGISHCAMKYALAISDPWNNMARGACIPRHPSRPSQKITAFQRITVTIGSGGFGYVLYSPTLANDVYYLYYSGSTYAGAIATVSSATVGNNSVAFPTLPYSKTNFIVAASSTSPSVAGRIVSANLSWQYTGTVSDMGGLTYALCHPDHNNLNSEAAGLTSYAETEVIRNDSRRHWVGASSLDDEEVAYSEGHSSTGAAHTDVAVLYPYSNREAHNTTDTSVGGSPIAVWFTGKAGNTFEVEILQHMEFIGAKTQSMLTPTHSDSVGFEVVQNAASRLPQMIQANPGTSRKSLMSQALNIIGSEMAPVARLGFKQLVGTAARGIAGAAMGYITGGPAGAVYGGALGVQSGGLMITNG